VACQKIPEISVGIQMEKSVSVSSDQNIQDHLWRWSTYFGWNIPTEIRRSIFDKPLLCPKLGNSEEEKQWQEPFPLVGPV